MTFSYLTHMFCSKSDGLKLTSMVKCVTLHIPANHTTICPVHLLRSYLVSRPKCQNQNLFIHLNTAPLTRYQFCAVLQKAFSQARLPGHYRSHSFRIGGATYLSESGVPDSKIMEMGRWKSEAYGSYIRLQH